VIARFLVTNCGVRVPSVVLRWRSCPGIRLGHEHLAVAGRHSLATVICGLAFAVGIEPLTA
jgi:hypothetical protein